MTARESNKFRAKVGILLIDKYYNRYDTAAVTRTPSKKTKKKQWIIPGLRAGLENVPMISFPELCQINLHLWVYGCKSLDAFLRIKINHAYSTKMFLMPAVSQIEGAFRAKHIVSAVPQKADRFFIICETSKSFSLYQPAYFWLYIKSPNCTKKTKEGSAKILPQ